MSRATRKSEDDAVTKIRKCQKIAENKKCADCSEKLPQYANLTFSTFVCTSCSGIHREFNHRVKSISLSNFTEEEAAALKKGGNEACNAKYLSLWNGRDYPQPRPGDQSAIRDWIKFKYIDKRWFRSSGDRRASKKDGERRRKKGDGKLEERKTGDKERRRRDSAKGKELKAPPPSTQTPPDIVEPAKPPPPVNQPANDLLGLVFDAPNPVQPSHPVPLAQQAPPQTDPFSAPPPAQQQAGPFSQPPPPPTHQPSDPFSQGAAQSHLSFAGAAKAVLAANAFQSGNPFDTAPQQFPGQPQPQTQQFPGQPQPPAAQYQQFPNPAQPPQPQANPFGGPQPPTPQHSAQPGSFQQPNPMPPQQMPGYNQQPVQAPQQTPGGYYQQQHSNMQGQPNPPPQQQQQHPSFAGAAAAVMATNAFAAGGQQQNGNPYGNTNGGGPAEKTGFDAFDDIAPPSQPQQSQPQPNTRPNLPQQMEGLNLDQGMQQQQQQQQQQFIEGENVLYKDASGQMFPAKINKIHYECTPPYFSVLIYHTGRERNTDAAHLVKAKGKATEKKTMASSSKAQSKVKILRIEIKKSKHLGLRFEGENGHLVLKEITERASQEAREKFQEGDVLLRWNNLKIKNFEMLSMAKQMVSDSDLYTFEVERTQLVKQPTKAIKDKADQQPRNISISLKNQKDLGLVFELQNGRLVLKEITAKASKDAQEKLRKGDILIKWHNLKVESMEKLSLAKQMVAEFKFITIEIERKPAINDNSKQLGTKRKRSERTSLEIQKKSVLGLPFEVCDGKLVLGQLPAQISADQEVKKLLKEGDIIHKVNDFRVGSLEMLTMALEMVEDSKNVRLHIERLITDDETETVKDTRKTEEDSKSDKENQTPNTRQMPKASQSQIPDKQTQVSVFFQAPPLKKEQILPSHLDSEDDDDCPC